MSNWITALIMAQEMCTSLDDTKNVRVEQRNGVGDHPGVNPSENNAENSPQQQLDALFQEALHQQVLDRICDRTSQVGH